MQSLHQIFSVIQIAGLIYLGGNALYLFFFAVCGFLKPDVKQSSFSRFRHITIVITAFKEDRIIDAVIKSALQQDYPEKNVEIILIADSFKAETLTRLRNFPVKVVEARFRESTKVQSLKLSIEHLNDKTEVIVLLDADNLMEMSFLRKLNISMDSGSRIIQCHRSAKNTNTSFAILDAISEEVNNNIFRRGHVAVGLSSALIGSAIAFNADLYRKYIPMLTAIGGFDKELELKLMKDKIFISYLPEAYVMDEKVQSTKVFYKQRKRWLSSQFIYFGRDFFPSILSLFREGNINYFNKTLQFSLLPRVLLLGILGIISVVGIFISNPVFNWLWISAFIVCMLSILISTPNQYYRKETLRALLYLPMAFFLMFSLLFRINKASERQFIHTEHDIQTP
ncbi:MAG: glycosyltransferase family 2 protein [Bacteroidota bacterium]|jgi:cellulose synthase/poly-beta-1,6-N-acetylglucosamine synthase-like glycosyltransferase